MVVSQIRFVKLKHAICAPSQCLGALAESAVVNNDTATCAACAAEFAKAIKQVWFS